MWPFSKRKATSPIPAQDSSGWGSPSVSGVAVTENRVMGLSAHFACVRLIATTLASLPVHIYERTADGKKRRNDHPAARLLREQPNTDMSAFSFFEAMQAQISNRGKAFAELVFDRKGNVAEIWPILPGVCQPQRKNKDSPIEYLFPNSGVTLPSWKILHIPGLGFDGINSLSPIQLFRQTFGFGMAVEEFGARFFGQGTNLGGFFEHPNKLSPDAHERLKTSMAAEYQGLQKSHKVIILEEGMKFEKLGMPLEDAQFIESRKFTATEIARIHGVPPHLIGDLEKATFSNIEEQGIEAVVYLFRPWVVRWEQSLNAKLFTEEERTRLYVKFELDGLLRGNVETRYKAYSIGLQNGFMNADEVREKEDMNPLPNGQGKVYRFPLNLAETVKEKKDA
jgi:HK97 family phage portal protein